MIAAVIMFLLMVACVIEADAALQRDRFATALIFASTAALTGATAAVFAMVSLL